MSAFTSPGGPDALFFSPSFTILFSPPLCPEVSGVAAVRAALRWAASPPAREPRPLPARFSAWTEGGGEGGPLSPSSCPALFGLHGKAPEPLPEVHPPGKALSGKGTQAPSRGEGPTWGSLWQQLGLHSVLSLPPRTNPALCQRAGLSLLPVTAPKASEVSLNQAQNSNGPRPAPQAAGPRVDVLSRAVGSRQARPPPMHTCL